MKLTENSIRNPIFTIVMSLALLVLGIMAYSKLEIRFFPKFEMPVVTVKTSYPGASASVIENKVTTPIENSLASINHIKYMTSSSSTGSSSITITFDMKGDLESEAAQVRDKVAGSVTNLPTNISGTPVVTVGTKGNKLIYMSYSDAKKSPTEIRMYLQHNILPLLHQVPGVGGVDLTGGAGYAMRIWLNPAKMAAYGVTVTDVKNTLMANNIYFAAGQVRNKNRLYTIVTKTQLETPSAFSNIIIKDTDKGTIRLKDIGTISLGFSTFEETGMKINGVNSVLMAVEPLQSANAITVAKNVRDAFAKIKQRLPAGMHASIIYDTSTYLKASIGDTVIAIVEAVALVIFVMFLFLGSWRAASVPIVTIPISLIAVFAIISLLGFSINMLSLLGLLLAIGLVVDDAIVMLENVYRYVENGDTPFQAALKGSKEIAFSIIAMTIVLVAVYVPIGFSSGISAQLFKEFAFTLAASVLISGFLALTLSPMMCAYVLREGTKESNFKKALDKAFEKITNSYNSLLNTTLKFRLYVIGGLVLIALLGVSLYTHMNSEFIPKEDYSLVNVQLRSPFNATVAYNEKYVTQVGEIAKKIPGIKTVIEQTDDNTGELFLILKPYSQRKLSAEQISTKLNAEISQIPGVDASSSIPDLVDYGDMGNDITINFVTAGDYKDLVPPMQSLMKVLKSYPGVVDPTNNLKFDSQQYALTINRDLAADLGVNLQDIADTTSVMMGGQHWTDVQSGSISYPVMVQMTKAYFSNTNAVKQLYVPSSKAKNNLVPLSTLVSLKPQISQGTYYHFNRLRSGTINANLMPGYTESQVLNYINKHLPGLSSSTITTAYSGKAAEYLESAGSMEGIMLLSFVFIYLVLAAQFGSFIDPFIILLPVPLSLVGGLISLRLGGGTINLYSEIGLITLVGMICKHGVLITQFANQLRSKGVALREALIKAATIRLRPILMTTAVMVLGSIPLAIATGAGSIGRRDIGLVIVGGLLVGTFFSLFVVPIAYSYIGRFHRLKQKKD